MMPIKPNQTHNNPLKFCATTDKLYLGLLQKMWGRVTPVRYGGRKVYVLRGECVKTPSECDSNGEFIAWSC